LLTALLAILLPYLRPIRASLATLLTAALILLLNYPQVPSQIGIPLEFQLFIILALFSLYILLSFIGEIRDRQKLTAIFSQYVPPELVEAYSKDPNSISLEGEAREITVLFCDALGFTTLSETMDPKAVAMWLNRYFSLISQIVVKHGGTLDKYIGDSVMAFWGAPVRSEDHAEKALAAALEMQQGIEALSKQYKAEGLPEIKVGIGISSGIGNVGNLGSHYRMAYTVVGDMVNMAQRLERKTRDYNVPIIVSQKTAEMTKHMLFRELDTVKVKGREEYTAMYQPLCLASAASPEFLESLAAHEKAMAYLLEKDWSRAACIFESLRDSWRGEPIYDIYLKRIDKLEHPR
jgi:adenylate cyclase